MYPCLPFRYLARRSLAPFRAVWSAFLSLDQVILGGFLWSPRPARVPLPVTFRNRPPRRRPVKQR